MEPLYGILEAMRQSLPGSLSAPLTECLLAYYPEGGYYKKHLDSVQNSASVLREYSFLIYLNPSWSQEDGGCLRIFKDPEGLDESDFVDVEPRDGTLVVIILDLTTHTSQLTSLIPHPSTIACAATAA